jgi:alpha-mannosidase
MAAQLNIIIVPHTHWDREWYQTFQQFRIRLVHTVDKLLDILDRDPNFTHFMLDGQTIVLDDYLEVRPEQEEHLKQYTRSGRVQVGPWYIQPDEFLVSGESLIRNLQVGLQRAAEFGNPMRVGYVPDCFGHIAQMPQILRGCRIDNAVYWRGVGSEAHKSEFYWAAPDGTKVLVIHLADARGYSNARDLPLNLDEFVAQVELLAAALLPKATTNNLLFMNGSDHLEPQDGLPEVIAKANKRLEHIDPEHARILTRLTHADQNGQTIQYDGLSLHIGTLPEYISAIQQYIEQHGDAHLQTLSGEMRSSQYSHLLPSVLSTRMWIKQQNALTEHLLERWVEPLTAWAWKRGAAYPTGLVCLAWKYLLQNHPHDSICGCSIDQVHRENAVRFAQSQQIGEAVIADAMYQLVSSVNTCAPSLNGSHSRSEAVPLVIFNPAPGPRTEAVRAEVHIPRMQRNAVIVDERGQAMPYHVVKRWRQELGTMSFPREMVSAAVALMGQQAPGDFIRIAESTMANYLNGRGSESPYEITSIHVEESPGEAHIELMVTPQGHTIANTKKLHAAERQVLDVLQREDIAMLSVTVIDLARETIDLLAADLPAYGLKTYWVYPHGLSETSEEQTPPSPAAAQAEELLIENEFYTVTASPEDGTLTVTDKQTGAIFTGLNHFVDGGDVGDLYNYQAPANDRFITAPSAPPQIEVLHSGSVSSTLRISGQWELPVSCSADRTSRSGRVHQCPITSEVTLIPGARRVDIHTKVENLVKDHRLRVAFPVPYTVEDASAEGTFEVRTRPVAAARPEDISEWAEEPVNSFPQKRFVDVSDGTIGLAVLNRGLPEYEVTKDENEQMAVAITLLRCVEWLSRGDLAGRRGHAGPMEHTPEGQCLGHHEFDYALVLHSGDWEAEKALVLHEAQAFNTPVRVSVTTQHEGQLPSHTSFVELEPRELVVSAIKRSNDGKGIIVRFYNPLSRAVEASLWPGFACSQAYVTNLLEEPGEQLFWNGEDEEPLHIGVRSGEIVTVLLI